MKTDIPAGLCFHWKLYWKEIWKVDLEDCPRSHVIDLVECELLWVCDAHVDMEMITKISHFSLDKILRSIAFYFECLTSSINLNNDISMPVISDSNLENQRPNILIKIIKEKGKILGGIFYQVYHCHLHLCRGRSCRKVSQKYIYIHTILNMTLNPRYWNH